MARHRRKARHDLWLIAAGAGALIMLITIAINNPWSVVSIAFILALLGLGVFGLLKAWAKMEAQFVQERQFKRVSHVRSTPQMAFLTPTDFEHYVGMLFSRSGYKVEITKQSGDEGIDLILRDKDTTTAVQVKRYLKGGVGRPEVQKLVGASLNRFDKMAFVTTSTFSLEATAYAALHRVELIDGVKLAALAEKVTGKDYIHKALSFSILERK